MGVVTCFGCANKIEFSDRVGFRAECDSCGTDLHICKNCVFYDPGSYNECKEPSAEVVKEKERANYCEWFQPSSNEARANTSRDDLLSAAQALFKKK